MDEWPKKFSSNWILVSFQKVFEKVSRQKEMRIMKTERKRGFKDTGESSEQPRSKCTSRLRIIWCVMLNANVTKGFCRRFIMWGK